MYSEEFKETHRLSKKYFVRERKLPFIASLLFNLSVLKCSLQIELNEFFKKLHDKCLPVHYVCSMSFCKARKKYSHSAFIDLNNTLINAFYEKNNPSLKELRVVSIDGTTYYLPYNKETIKEFGTGENDKPYVLARGSVAYDVMSGIVIDAFIDSESISENIMLYEHTKKLNENDLVLADRGYTAFWIMALLMARDIKFCIRMCTSQTYVCIKDFLASKEQSMVATISPTEKSIPFLKEYNLKNEPIQIRLIKVQLDKEIEILATSLMDETKFPTEYFKQLYHQRWAVEEAYKSLKSKMEVENFSGKSPQVIKQDFYAKIFSFNLASIYTYFANQKIVYDSTLAEKENKHSYKANLKGGINIVKASMVKLFYGGQYLGELLKDILETMSKNTNADRPDREYPRDVGHKKRYPMPYKSC